MSWNHEGYRDPEVSDISGQLGNFAGGRLVSLSQSMQSLDHLCLPTFRSKGSIQFRAAQRGSGSIVIPPENLDLSSTNLDYGEHRGRSNVPLIISGEKPFASTHGYFYLSSFCVGLYLLISIVNAIMCAL